jgi:HEAT repeat protein
MAKTDRIPTLMDQLKCDDGIQNRKARLALVKLGPTAVPALIEGTKSTNSTVRWESLKALSQIGDQQSIDTLVDHLSDNDGRGWVAADGLARIGGKAVMPVLEAIVSRSGSSEFRDGAHHFLSKLTIDDNEQATLKSVSVSLEGPEASLEAPLAARKALAQLQSG